MPNRCMLYTRFLRETWRKVWLDWNRNPGRRHYVCLFIGLICVVCPPPYISSFFLGLFSSLSLLPLPRCVSPLLYTILQHWLLSRQFQQQRSLLLPVASPLICPYHYYVSCLKWRSNLQNSTHTHSPSRQAHMLVGFVSTAPNTAPLNFAMI